MGRKHKIQQNPALKNKEIWTYEEVKRFYRNAQRFKIYVLNMEYFLKEVGCMDQNESLKVAINNYADKYQVPEQIRENMHIMRRNRNLDSHEIIPDFEKKDVLGIDYYDSEQVEGYRKYYNNPNKQKKIPLYKTDIKSHIEIKKIYDEDSQDLMNKQIQHIQEKKIKKQIQISKSRKSSSNHDSSDDQQKNQIIQACFYGENCRVENCPYQHPLGKFDFNKDCKFGDKCIEYPNCYFKHPNKPHIPKLLDQMKKKSIILEKTWGHKPQKNNSQPNDQNMQQSLKKTETGYDSDDDGYEIVRKKKYPNKPCPFGVECIYKNSLSCDYGHPEDKIIEMNIQKNVVDHFNEKVKQNYSGLDSGDNKVYKSQQCDMDDSYSSSSESSLKQTTKSQNLNIGQNQLQVNNSQSSPQKSKKLYFKSGWDLEIPIKSQKNSLNQQKVQIPLSNQNNLKQSGNHLTVNHANVVQKTQSDNIQQQQKRDNSQTKARNRKNKHINIIRNVQNDEKQQPQRQGHTYKICIKNIPYRAIAEDLNNFFQDILNFKPQNLYLIYDKQQGQSKGYGFADFNSMVEQNLACQLDGYKFMGRKLKINEA